MTTDRTDQPRREWTPARLFLVILLSLLAVALIVFFGNALAGASTPHALGL